MPPVRSSDLLGCKFLFDARNDITPFALGPLKLSTNVLNAIGITGYPRNKYTPIYEDFFIPELISNSCIEFDGSIGSIKSSIISYSNSESYSKQVAKSNSISVDVSGSGGGGGFAVAASAGYAESTKRQTADSGFTRSAYGIRKTIKEIAKISINCLNKESIVDLELKDLIKPEVAEDWKFIRAFNQTKKELVTTPQFQRVATGGFIQPTTYLYSATVRLSTDTLYTENESSDSSAVSKELTASLSASYSGIFAEGKITASTAVSNAVSDGLMDSGIESRSETVRIATGTPNITSDCILANQASCEEVVTQEVATVFGNINNFVTVPSEQIGSVSLNEIVKGYFNDSIGLGKPFFELVGETFGIITSGNVFLNFYFDNIGCNNVFKEPTAYLLKLNECTLIKRGPPKSIYYKVSIEGQSYRVIEANNAECIPRDPIKDVALFPFGVCSDRNPDEVFGELSGLNAPGPTSGAFSVFLSDFSLDNDGFFDCSLSGVTAVCGTVSPPEDDDFFGFLSF